MRRSAGSFRHRATVLRRAVQTGVAGRPLGDFAAVDGLTSIAVGYRELSLRDHQLGNGVQGAIDAEVTLRDCAAARTIGNADRITISGQGFAIVSAGLPDAQDGIIRLLVKRLRG